LAYCVFGRFIEPRPYDLPGNGSWSILTSLHPIFAIFAATGDHFKSYLVRISDIDRVVADVASWLFGDLRRSKLEHPLIAPQAAETAR
jgi:hypothetical protein